MADSNNNEIDLKEVKIDQSDLDILNDDKSSKEDDSDDSKKDDKEVKEKEKEEDIDEVPEVDEEDVDKVDEDEEVEETKARPSLKTMMEKVPELGKVFKEFPQLRDAYFREGKFSQLFPGGVDEAKDSAEKAEALDVFNDAIMSGSSIELLEAISKDSKEAYTKFVEGFLPTLAKADENSFLRISTPIVDTVIRNLYRSGQSAKDNNRMAAARILNEFLHGTPDIKPPKTADPELENEKKKLDDDRKKLLGQAGSDFESNVHTRVGRSLESHLNKHLESVEASSFVKSSIVAKIIDAVGDELEKDRSHMALMSKLMKTAAANRFRSDTADSIVNAYLSRAKQLLPDIRKKVIKEALGKDTSRPKGIAKTTSKDITPGRKASGKNDIPLDPKKVDWKKTSDRDILG